MRELVQAAQKRDRLQILVAAEFVRNPVTVTARIIEVKHGCHRIHAQTVHMKLVEPVESASDQKIPDLVAPEIEDVGSPVAMFTLARIGVLIQRCTVKTPEGKGVLREMRRNPVENHSDSLLVHIVHKIGKILRRTVTRSRRIEARDLIPP